MSQPTTNFSIEGRLIKVFEMEQKGASAFSVRNFAIEVQGQYPQLIQFQLTQDRCALIDKFNADEPIRVHFDLRGREWNGKYLTNLHAWKLDRLADEAPQPTAAPSAPQAAPAPAKDDAADIFTDEDLELPF